MSKHTPGPWTVGPDGMDVIGDGSPVCHLGQYGEIKPWRGCKNLNANARLIAAAPDLLEACKALAAYVAQEIGVPLDECVSGPIGIARAAIAKAESP